MYSKRLAETALGLRKAELVLKNAKIVQVLTGEIITGDIAVSEGMIAGIGEYAGEKEVDLKGQYVCPGFIDAHLHLESTLVRPSQLIHCALLCGTTAFIADPHEAANVSGTAGIDFILNETSHCDSNVYIMMPSCVPSDSFEDNGFTLTAGDMKKYKDNPRILGLGEVMDQTSVLSCKEEMMRKLALFQDMVIDGHAGFLSEKETQCYCLSGIHTDHECCTYEDAMREMRAGMYLLIREGTAAKNLEAIVSGIISHKTPVNRFCFCTDDKHIEEIKKNGHISNNIRKAIALGMSPMDAIKMATLNPAECYGLSQEGAIAPGRQANLVVLSDLNQILISDVYYRGKKVTPDTIMLSEEETVPKPLLHTVNIKFDGQSSFALPVKNKVSTVIEIIPGEITTKKLSVSVPAEGGYFIPNLIYQKIAILERHHKTGKSSIGIVKGFHIKGGALASTVGHDSHNMIVIGDNDHDMERAVRALCDSQGGYAVVKSQLDPLVLPLPVMGLISNESHEKVQEKLSKMILIAHEMGVPKEIDPFITMSFLALPVIPEVRITTRGIYDVVKGEFIV